MKVHARLDGPLETVTTAEDKIVTTIESVLSGTSIAESSRILEILQMRLVAARIGQSIVLYIWCKTVEELLRFYEFLTSGRLKDTAELLFNQLLTLSQKVVVRNITMSDEEFESIKAYFTGDQLFIFKFKLDMFVM